MGEAKVTMSLEDQEAIKALELRVQTILPSEYRDCYEDVQPVSMGSARLKYGSDGRVAWDEIWGTFCDLAMAGGPPHKGTLLEPGSAEEIDADSERYSEVIEEICRGIFMVTELTANRSTAPGRVRVECVTQSMAEWLVRAIVMENVSAHYEGTMIELPAAPGYRIEKEIKNVITAIAKTSHYWLDHMWLAQHLQIGNLFLRMKAKSPLIQPALPGHDFQPDAHYALSRRMAEKFRQTIGFRPADHQYAGWLGVECPTVRAAIWMMRALVVSNILARREATFCPSQSKMRSQW
jgi:sirohydrochlorin cobaltochelatase